MNMMPVETWRVVRWAKEPAITYIIDGENRRVGKKVNGTLVESFLYEDDLKRVGWYDGAGALKAQFVFGARADLPDIMIKGGATYRLVPDQVGSIRLVSDSTGAIAERIDYDEFGNVLQDTNSGSQPFRFAGGLRDSDSGLDRFGVRDYDPQTGKVAVPHPGRYWGQ